VHGRRRSEPCTVWNPCSNYARHVILCQTRHSSISYHDKLCRKAPKLIIQQESDADFSHPPQNFFVLHALLSWDHMGRQTSQVDVYTVVCSMLVEAGIISKSDPRDISRRLLVDRSSDSRGASRE
jgi:hypothetical protein